MTTLRTIARDLHHLYRVDYPAFDAVLRELSPQDSAQLLRCWQTYARENQLRPADCRSIWMILAGRGFGKTRTGAEWVLDRCEDWGRHLRGVLCSKTIGDTREDMILGDSGLVACAQRRGYDLDYKPGRAVLFHPAGGKFRLTSGEIPDGCRGPNINFFWGDEIAFWKYANEVWNNLRFCWRLSGPYGAPPEGLLTTTPRPNQIIHRLVLSDEFTGQLTLTTGSTLDNAANLDPVAVQSMRDTYEGTRLGDQELHGKILAGQGTIVDMDTIHRHRVTAPPEQEEIIVSVDPAISDDEGADQAGIAVVGRDHQDPAHAYVFEARGYDRGKSAWAPETVRLALEHRATKVIVEVNQGKDYIPEDLQVAIDALSRELGREIVLPIETVWQKQSKTARATPVGALYERGRIHHLRQFVVAERELTTWMEGMDSPNVMDAIVQGVTYLLLRPKPRRAASTYWGIA